MNTCSVTTSMKRGNKFSKSKVIEQHTLNHKVVSFFRAPTRNSNWLTWGSRSKGRFRIGPVKTLTTCSISHLNDCEKSFCQSDQGALSGCLALRGLQRGSWKTNLEASLSTSLGYNSLFYLPRYFHLRLLSRLGHSDLGCFPPVCWTDVCSLRTPAPAAPVAFVVQQNAKR